MSRRLAFHRDFRGYTGGHGKVWDYFNHANAHPAWQSTIFQTAESIAQDNPWTRAGVRLESQWPPAETSALFLAGSDWLAWPAASDDRPVINLVQGMRHADPDNPLHGFLSRRALRVCVSQAVADAICASGHVNGPVVVIPAAIELAALPEPPENRRGVFIGATKQPGLGRALAEHLRRQGREVNLADEAQPRPDFLAGLAACRVAVLLPFPKEGFFLPGLEAMALGCATVVPDCLGNRQYLRPGRNALAPVADLEALIDAVLQLDDQEFSDSMSAEGRATAAAFDLPAERQAFHQLLDSLDTRWAQ